MRSRLRSLTRNTSSLRGLSTRQYHSYHKANSSTHARVLNGLRFAGFVGAAGLYAHSVITSNVKRPVIDEPILSEYGYNEFGPEFVLSLGQLNRVNNYTSGRTCGYRAYIENTNQQDFYFYKETFDRVDLVRELFYGALGNYLCSNTFPEVFLVEERLNNSENQSKYAFLSENVGDDEDNDDLEEWALALNNEAVKNRVSPRHGGVAMAFAMLTGQSDCKLANLAVIRDLERAREGSCYTIDFESCGEFAPSFLETYDQAFEFIGEFRSKTYSELTLEQNGDGMLDTEHDIHKPIRDMYELKEQIRPILSAAIDRDLEDGSVIALYRRFAAMTHDDFVALYDRFGPFINEQERKLLLDDMQSRQEQTIAYLNKYDLLQQASNQSDESETYAARNLM